MRADKQKFPIKIFALGITIRLSFFFSPPATSVSLANCVCWSNILPSKFICSTEGKNLSRIFNLIKVIVVLRPLAVYEVRHGQLLCDLTFVSCCLKQRNQKNFFERYVMWFGRTNSKLASGISLNHRSGGFAARSATKTFLLSLSRSSTPKASKTSSSI